MYSFGLCLLFQAQKLVFEYSNAGDIRNLISAYFDTTIGSKVEAKSYENIANELNLEGQKYLFVTDNINEANACKSAGFGKPLAEGTLSS